jgi:acyl carrier protein
VRGQAESDSEAAAFVLSRHVGFVRLDPSHVIATHVLGRRRVIGGPGLLEALSHFRTPRPVDPATAGPVFEALRRAGIAQPQGTVESDWIRSAYTRASTLAEIVPPPILAPLQPSGVESGGDALVGARLTPSPNLATLDLDRGERLATHPSGPCTHLADDLWQVLRSFDGGRPVQCDERHVAHFLMARGLLWRGDNEERAASVAACGIDSQALPDLEVIEHAGDLFRQIHRPYSRRHVDRPTVHRRVALIGPCLSQQFAECLEYHGLSRGWLISTLGRLAPDGSLARHAPHLVVLHAGQYVAWLVEFAGQGRWEECGALVERIVDAVLEVVREVRRVVASPIAVAVARPPALGVLQPGSRDALRLEALFADVNMALADALEAIPDAAMLDEMDMRERMQPGVYWDDRYNTASHRAPLSSWNWTLLKPGRTDGPVPADSWQFAPPPRPAQADPAGPMAFAVLERLAELTDVAPVGTVIFEPRGLLWPVAPAANDLARAAQRNFLVDVEDYGFAGAAEALAALARRGIRLVCLTDGPAADLDRGIAQTLTAGLLISRERIDELHATDDKRRFVERFLAGASASDDKVLWIDFSGSPAPQHPALIVFPPEARWNLREMLLRAPELAGRPMSREAPRADDALADAASTAGATALRDRVCDALRTALVSETKCSADDLEDAEDLADLGLDSLGVVRVLAHVEQLLDCRIDSWERFGERLFRRSSLEAIFLAALQAKAGPAAVESPGPA